MDEREKIQRIRRIKVILTEFLMFISVICLVIILTLVVMGYSFNLKRLGGEGELIERTGLVQISSKPVGATIEVDGGSPLLLRTNSSKTVVSGTHNFSLKKEGYRSWSKDISVKEGMMYRLNYPRLFLEKIEAETALKLEGVTGNYASPNMEKMLIVQKGKLYVVNLNETTLSYNSFGTKELFSDIKSFEVIGWSGNSERMLAKINGDLVVLNLRTPGESISLKDLIAEIKVKQIEFETEAGDELLMLSEGGDLREVDIRNKKIGEVLAKGVISFDNDGDRVVYLTKKSDEVQKEEIIDENTAIDEANQITEEDKAEIEREKDWEYELRSHEIGSADSYLVAKVEHEGAKIATMSYYGDYLFGIADLNFLRVYSCEDWPTGDGEVGKMYRGEISFEAEGLEKRGKGMVFEIKGKEKDAIFDAEAIQTVELAKASGWVDEFLRYSVLENGIEVEDYDGLNKIKVVEGEINDKMNIFISGNGKWLYYFEGESLKRAKIRN